MKETKLLVIVITTAAIIAAVTTTSLSAATPAFAKVNCDPDGSVCSGGTSWPDRPGGFGTHFTFDEASGESSMSGGSGDNTGTFVGGGGGHRTCDLSGCQEKGGFGGHDKGPGGNSGK